MLDLIIVNYKSTDFLLKCLESIYGNHDGLALRIFVEDNNSDDGVARVTDRFPDVELSVNKYNMGFGAAINKALDAGTAPYVVLLNPDSKVAAGALKTMADYMESHPDVAIVRPKILDTHGTIQGSARSFPTPLTALFGRTSLFTKLFPNNRISMANLMTQQCDGITPMEVDWVSGACMMVRRAAIAEVGKFDERFFMYWEDADWCRRMWDAGWKITYLPRASVTHHVGKSSSKLLARSVFEFHKSVYRLFEKYNPPSIWPMKPLIVTGLFLRMSFIFLFSKLTQYIDKHQADDGAEIDEQVFLPAPKIKILRMIARLNIGGPAIHVHLLTQGLDPQRFETKLVTGKISPQEGDMSYLFTGRDQKPSLIPELQREISMRMDIKAWLRIFRILEAEQPDIVHTHTAKAGFSARFAVMIYNLIFNQRVQVVHTFHGHVFEGYFSAVKSHLFVWIERLIAQFTNVIIAISQTQRLELIHKYKIAAPEKVKTIELGFDLHPFLSCKRYKGDFRRQLNLDDETTLIGIIGRLVPIKNHRLFIDAARIFLEQNPEISAKFIVVGDGELRTYLEAYCRHNGMADHVLFCGWIKNVPKVYADIDILALTSLNEGTPVSIIEAMAASVPVIATDVGGVRDLLGGTELCGLQSDFSVCERGILSPATNCSGVARGIGYLIAENHAVMSRRIYRAKSFVERNYNQKRLLTDIEMLYLEMMQHHHYPEQIPGMMTVSTSINAAGQGASSPVKAIQIASGVRPISDFYPS